MNTALQHYDTVLLDSLDASLPTGVAEVSPQRALSGDMGMRSPRRVASFDFLDQLAARHRGILADDYLKAAFSVPAQDETPSEMRDKTAETPEGTGRR